MLACCYALLPTSCGLSRLPQTADLLLHNRNWSGRKQGMWVGHVHARRHSCCALFPPLSCSPPAFHF
eukprot:269280-Pelagomonas_calceolata.AAC.2